MRKLVVLLLISLYSVGNVLFPGVDMAHLQDMYRECAVEDPDINAADFVVEHLLNIPEIFADPAGTEENEKPHQSTYIVSAFQLVAIVNKVQEFHHNAIVFPEDTRIFNGYAQQHFPTGFSGRMLRPPIV
ncbi:MAG: hypothetical protein KF744_02060 [Taibaiella sp.]|nr:hypothetical protein [Taibaiella sp.]